MRELPDEVWDMPSLPGRAGSGLIGCIWITAIPTAIIAAICLLVVGGTVGLTIAGVVGGLWLLFIIGSVWQIREMRRAGGYTRITPPTD